MSAFTLPILVRRHFADDAGVVLSHAASLYESAAYLAPTKFAEEQFEAEVRRILDDPPADSATRRRALKRFAAAAAAVVGHANPGRPWFVFGLAVGRWRQQVLDRLRDLVESVEEAADGGGDPARRLSQFNNYATPSLAPIFRAAAQIPVADALGITPVRCLAAAWGRDRDDLALRRVVREFAPGDAFDAASYELDLRAVGGFEVATARALENAAADQRSTPCWVRATGMLLYQGRAIRTYAGRATSANPILDLFQHEGWPEVVKLPPMIQPCVHDAVKSLNNGQTEIRFRADGTGTGVAWTPGTS